jgi:hypothetical protein
MWKRFLPCLLSGLLLLGLAPLTAYAAGGGMAQASPETIKSQIAKLGVGAKAKTTIRLTNGTKIKGYIAQVGEDDFVIRDRKTDTPTTVRYADVTKVERNSGHSMARNVAIGVAIGAGAIVAVLAIIFASLND